MEMYTELRYDMGWFYLGLSLEYPGKYMGYLEMDRQVFVTAWSIHPEQ